jgi:hypothetical protein
MRWIVCSLRKEVMVEFIGFEIALVGVCATRGNKDLSSQIYQPLEACQMRFLR